MHQPVLPSPIGFLLLPQFTSIALACAIEPLRIANRYVPDKYTWQVLSLDGSPVPDGNGTLVQADHAYDRTGRLGSLFLLADIRPERFYSRPLKDWLHRQDRQGVVLASLDTACFVLARAGLLDGHRATPHWEVIDTFRERFANVAISPTLFDIGERRLCGAGGSAVLDMMLTAIGLDHGQAVANRVAEHCLVDRIRAADSWQRMALPLRSGAHHPTLVRAIRLIEDNPQPAPTVSGLSRTLGISERHLLRLFRDHLGETAHDYLLRVRLERARALLVQSDLSVTEIAQVVGYGSVAHFSRAYRRFFGRTPSAGRRKTRPDNLLMDADR
ncbi:MAG: GlxA family transcriptional regulator [Burkholderiaceae bacterium]